MVTAAAAGEVDMLIQFQVVGGEALFDNPDFNVVGFPAATHRQIWMRCDTGQFTDKRVRQALGYSIDRPALIDTLFKGKADIGNDHVIAPVYPFFDPSVPQRPYDPEMSQAAARRCRLPRRHHRPCCTSATCRRSRSWRS